MNIYELIFGTDSGQVCCCFHNDTKASAGIGPEMQYNCFACGAKAHDEISFISKYFKTNTTNALKIKTWLYNVDRKYYHENAITQEQRNYLNSIGITDKIINQFFFTTDVGVLICKHTSINGNIGYTIFNNPILSNYNISMDKYVYRYTCGGTVSPLETAMCKNTIVITEGEKDMLTAKSLGINNAVAKLGGAQTPLYCAEYFNNKNIIIVYDCDRAGREGAIVDATNLITKCNCNVKIVDLQLSDKEDLNDYFIKYHKTKKDFIKLTENTITFKPNIELLKTSKVQSYVDLLSTYERNELIEYLVQTLTKKEKDNIKNKLNKEDN